MPQKKQTDEQVEQDLDESLKLMKEQGVRGKGCAGDVDPDMDAFWEEQMTEGLRKFKKATT
jgi:hypothetical protein